MDRKHIDRTTRQDLADAEEESRQMSDRFFTNSSLRKETRSISLPSAPSSPSEGDELARFDVERQGGIGMSFSTGQDGKFYIMGLRSGSPAAICGQMKVGDILLNVDGIEVDKASRSYGKSLSQLDVANLLRGPVGSKVTMRLSRRGSEAQDGDYASGSYEVTLVRVPLDGMRSAGLSSPRHPGPSLHRRPRGYLALQHSHSSSSIPGSPLRRGEDEKRHSRS